MISESSARNLAEALIGPFKERGLATDTMIESATRLILQAVEIDELEKEIARKESKHD